MNPPPFRKKQNRSSFPAFLIFAVTIILILGIGGALFAKNYYEKSITTPNSSSDEKVTFVVESGATGEQIASKLVVAGLLNAKHEKIFVLYLRQSGEGAKIQAGEFKIAKNLNIKELAKSLQDSRFTEVSISFQEGLRVDEITKKIASQYKAAGGSVTEASLNKLVTDKEFISTLEIGQPKTLEGFLFPDGYRMALDGDEKYIIHTLVENYKKKAGTDLKYEQLILASIIEREGRNDEERRMIADILQRRLKDGTPLGVDAANLYYHKDWKRVLTFQDLELDHPYNTRLHSGLTPTPICNPGLSSIDAVRNPKRNQYYFYLHDNNGKIHYASTLAEHNQNISIYLR